ncbi:hypothetical protein GF382_02340 [Candidatus Falkowbacteria bacterium]|nr:hypothetical protein [Candidatus Falkowbacteria bacterium]
MKLFQVSCVLSLWIVAVQAGPTISSPANGAEFVKGKSGITFLFSAVSTASYVELWIDNHEGFGSPEVGYDNGVSPDYTGSNGIVSAGASFNLTKTMQNGLPQNLYYAKARLLDADKNAVGGWGTTISFSLLSWRNAPAITYPSGQAEFTKGDGNIVFSISNTQGADKLEVWIDNLSGFGSPEIGYDNGAGSPWIRDGIGLASQGFTLENWEQELLDQNLYYAKARFLSQGNMPVSDWGSVAEFVLLDPVQDPTECYFFESFSNINCSASGKTGSISFSFHDQASSCDWTTSSDMSWIQITSATQGTGNGSISYSILENTSTSQRQGKITLSTSDETREIAVTQEAAEQSSPANLVLSASRLYYQSDGTVQTITLSNSGEEELSWAVSNNPAWTHIVPSSGTVAGGQSATISISLDALEVQGSRTQCVTFSNQVNSSDKEDLCLEQEGISEPQIVKAFDCLSSYSQPLYKQYPEGKECPHYMNVETGIGIYGDADTWFQQAVDKGFPTGLCPAVSSIIVFAKVAGTNMSHGHVGLVKAINGNLLTLRDCNWGLKRVVREHDIDVRNYQISGYIYCGYTIPSCGSGDPIATTPAFSADSFMVASVVKEDTSAYQVFRAETCDTFVSGDSVYFFSKLVNAKGVVSISYDITKSGEDFHFYGEDHNTEGELLPYFYPSYAYNFSLPGVYNCKFTAENRGGKYEYLKNFVVLDKATAVARTRGKLFAPTFCVRTGRIAFSLAKSEHIQAKLMNCQGRILADKSGNFSKGRHEFSVGKLPAGVYLLYFRSAELEKKVKFSLF